MLPDKKPNVKIAVIGGGFVGITLAARLLEVENYTLPFLMTILSKLKISKLIIT
jgi:NADH dehydrogenase FAD-containing subunit